MRTVVLAPLALLALMAGAAQAAGRGATETCVTAGYRTGTAAFDMCVARVSGDDPMAALEGGELSPHGDGKGKPPAAEADPLAAIAPAKTPLAGAPPHLAPAREDLPASFNAPSLPAAPPSAPPQSSLPSPGGAPGVWPTPPTAPTLPNVIAPSLPWNFGPQ